jgi:hypothetical protein
MTHDIQRLLLELVVAWLHKNLEIGISDVVTVHRSHSVKALWKRTFSRFGFLVSRNQEQRLAIRIDSAISNEFLTATRVIQKQDSPNVWRKVQGHNTYLGVGALRNEFFPP